MKTAFTRPLSRLVTLTHGTADGGEEQIQLALHPVPAGFRAYMSQVYPDPVEYVNAKPTGIDRARLPRTEWYRTLAMIAKSLGDELETRPPTGSAPDMWIAYAENVELELQRAGVTEGDVIVLARELAKVDNGAGNLGNASAGAGAA